LGDKRLPEFFVFTLLPGHFVGRGGRPGCMTIVGTHYHPVTYTIIFAPSLCLKMHEPGAECAGNLGVKPLGLQSSVSLWGTVLLAAPADSVARHLFSPYDRRCSLAQCPAAKSKRRL
jgi:hypothetical protein